MIESPTGIAAKVNHGNVELDLDKKIARQAVNNNDKIASLNKDNSILLLVLTIFLL